MKQTKEEKKEDVYKLAQEAVSEHPSVSDLESSIRETLSVEKWEELLVAADPEISRR